MNRKLVVVVLGTVAALAIASPSLGGPSLKSLVKKEVTKQLAGKTGPAGPQGTPGPPGSQANLTVEPFHAVGAAGEPPFQNSWVNFGSGLPPASFYKDPLGRVHLRGTVKDGTYSVPIFTLPPGYRPEFGENHNALDSVVIVVNTDGRVVPFGSVPNVNINDISFRAGG